MTLPRRFLDMAARAALRAAGDVEPNPMVGCVIARADTILGIGHHQKFGGPHAEVNALADCARRANDPRGATAYVTLEPCSHFGKQPPCCDALIRAGVARVVCARPDPNPVSGGGAARLAAAGIPCEFTRTSALASHLADPFAMRIEHRRPWVILKWAQTIDGRTATRDGESQWISSPSSRREVHRLRARVDCILAAIGTVQADNPTLTARGVSRVRRVARRAVIDPRLELPEDCNLLQTLEAAPLTVFTTAPAAERPAREPSPSPAASKSCPFRPAPERATTTSISTQRSSTSARTTQPTCWSRGAVCAGGCSRRALPMNCASTSGPCSWAMSVPPRRAGIQAPRWPMPDGSHWCARRIGPDAALTYRRA